MRWLGSVASLAGLPFAAASGYLFALTLGSRRRAGVSEPTGELPRFDVFVPAHNEEQGIAATVQSLLGVGYPKDRFRVVVIADNCTDSTAARAASTGATVLERQDAKLRGKGHALAHAFAWGKGQKFADAVVVVDADTLVSENLLRAFAVRLQGGAHALQADYAVRNPEASWRTQLMAVALSTFHEVRSVARENWGLSCGLRGNGMCFSYDVLGRVPYQAFSIVEDVEFGIALGEAQCAVRYVAEAHVYGEMVSTEEASRSQRRRWEEGRRALVREKGWPLLARAAKKLDPVLFDLALDLVIPPLATLATAVLVGLLGSVALAIWTGSGGVAVAIWTASAAGLVCYVFRGWWLSGTGWRGLRALARAPLYVAWKLSLKLRPSSRSARRPATDPDAAGDEWVRTTRETVESDRPNAGTRA